MRIVSIGGGPAGLFFSILMKRAFPETEITVYERNRADDTFGWGVVFSRETLGNLQAADPESYAEIEGSFSYWDDIHTWYGGTRTVSTGHGFCGLARRTLLQILQARALRLGVDLRFETEAPDVESLRDADLVLGADGVNSIVRERYKEHFRPDIDWRRCKFSWLGTTLPLEAFTFVFIETPHGVFQVHAYPFEKGLSTWIVECREETWRAAGHDQADEEQTVAFCEELFAPWLDGHRLLKNRSVWRTFPTIRCVNWHHGNVVLLGDSAHTAHFSIGSGTKLAMEDAIALVDAFRDHPGEDVQGILNAYQDARYVEVLKLQKAAQTSLEWFENSARYMGQPPLQFSFNLMTRSKRITYNNLRQRDPELVSAVTAWFREAVGAPLASDGSVPAPVFTPFRVGGLSLSNRIVVSPMCQYSATDGTVGEWHLVHLGSRAIGGAGLVMTEMTNVTPEGRITPGCTGMYAPEHVAAWRRIVDFIHGNSGSRIGIQLAHAGRKGAVDHPWEGDDQPLAEPEAWETLAPSPAPFRPHWRAPRAMDRADMERVRDAFAASARMALEAGFDLVELHMAHGYLLSSFLSPLSNERTDAYGGTLENRLRFPLEVLDAVRAAWPAERPLAVRISATDWLDHEGGQTVEESVEIARQLAAHGCDLVDVSTAGNVPESHPEFGRMYQVPFADRIRHEAVVPVMAVGAIQGPDHANTVIAAGRADLCALARPHLVNPYITLQASLDLGYPDAAWPGQYLAGRTAPIHDV